MRFLVFDDQREEVERLVRLLAEAFPGAEVWPRFENPIVFRSWEEIDKAVDKEPDDAGTVAFFDLAIMGAKEKPQYPAASLGRARVKLVRKRRPKWTLIRFTRFATDQEDGDGTNGLLRKIELDEKQTQEGQLRLVKAVVRAASTAGSVLALDSLCQRSIEDSPALRQVQAGLGPGGLDEILDREAPGWEAVTVRALSGGYSGAYVLLLSGDCAGVPQEVVIKAARDRMLLDLELKARETHLGRLGELASHFVFSRADVRTLDCGAGFYFGSAKAPGTGLLELNEGDRMSAVRRFLALERSQYEAALENSPRVLAAAGGMLTLSAVDIARIRASARELARVGKAAQRRGFWPEDLVAPEECGLHVSGLAAEWPVLPSMNVKVFTCLQHGDANPRNVFVGRDGTIAFIDPARLREWPLGYDVARCSTQLRLRLLGADSGEDCFADSLRDWCRWPQPAAGAAAPAGLCPESEYCDEQFEAFCLAHEPESRQRLLFGYWAAACWDLLKVMSYGDASVFKRLWAMVWAHRIAAWMHEAAPGLIPAEPVEEQGPQS
ncbi:MAG: aminoglycoside phosphotransferase family protein [Thermoanaerobaculia bacterium]|nr:aminoglycoside phosphotransferase family protein [Thermoanaerobaculia bacterium]